MVGPGPGKGALQERNYMILDISQTNAHHATATVESSGLDTDARWTAIEQAALASGWRLMGWRNYAIGDEAGSLAYRTTVDLFRTSEDVRTGAIQTATFR